MWQVLVAAFAAAGLSAKVPADGFPVPRAQAEFRLLGPHVRGYCGAIGGDEEGFRRAVAPYGPMDLAVTKGSGEEAGALRDLYLGMAGTLCRVDVVAMLKRFECGRSCVIARRDALRAKLPAIRDLVRGFQRLERIRLLSQWGIRDEYRIDNVFVMLGQVKETRPSAVMGFVPSDVWTALGGPSEYLRRIGVPEADLKVVLNGLKRDALVALVADGKTVRVVAGGMGKIESGLIFLGDARSPAIGERIADGRRYVFVEPLERGIVYYETN